MGGWIRPQKNHSGQPVSVPVQSESIVSMQLKSVYAKLISERNHLSCQVKVQAVGDGLFEWVQECNIQELDLINSVKLSAFYPAWLNCQ